MGERPRIEILLECSKSKKEYYRKYVDIITTSLKETHIKPSGIDISDFPNEKTMKYFPNYQQEVSF
jgi:hypothetical protein